MKLVQLFGKVKVPTWAISEISIRRKYKKICKNVFVIIIIIWVLYDIQGVS